jgi:hypothetical protein
MAGPIIANLPSQRASVDEVRPAARSRTTGPGHTYAPQNPDRRRLQRLRVFRGCAAAIRGADRTRRASRVYRRQVASRTTTLPSAGMFRPAIPN